MLKIATVFADLRSVGEASDCYTLHCVQCVESVDVKKQQRVGLFMITSPPRAVAKYRDECVCMCVCVSLRLCLSVCLSVGQDGPTSGTIRAIFTNFLCMLPMSVTRSSSGTLTIGRIAYRREAGDGSAQRGRSVIYDCVVRPMSNSERHCVLVEWSKMDS